MPLRRFPGDLGGSPHRIVHAPNGKAGLQLSESGNPDIIILDTALPDLDGASVIRALRENDVTSQTPLIILSSPTDIESMTAARSYNVESILTKPYSFSDLESICKELVEKRNSTGGGGEDTERGMAVAHGNGRTALRLFPGWTKTLKTDLQRIITAETRVQIARNRIIIDIRVIPELTPKEIATLEKLVAVFKSNSVLILAGRHFGSLLAMTDLEEEERVNMFITIEEMNEFLAAGASI